MKPFDVYPLFNINIVRGSMCCTYDENGTEYLDLYGGHAVISIGHSHPYFVEKMKQQLNQLIFYSNSVKNPLQIELAKKMGEISGYTDYSLFLVNSGAEANENALKLASFHTKRNKVIAFKRAFHGRTSAAVRVTDNPQIIAPINSALKVEYLPLNDNDATTKALQQREACAVIIEGIQGVGGVHIPTTDFLQHLRRECSTTDTVLILDEIQSGYGRSGRFFAHQYADIRPDIITVAKGMGNGFPIGGVLIAPTFEAKYGMLGTTFGGNHLACTAAIAVLDIIKRDHLIENAAKIGTYLKNELLQFKTIKNIRGKGLMIGLEFDFEISELRKKLLFEHKIFTGASGKNIIRLLPPLCITQTQANEFLEKFQQCF